ncbi:integral membrane regulator [Streptomyces sp. YC537]|uniref:Integral membrane regulator n=1 Tax=Streptomyces boluensis TaxID=1775135 RepID=A0A964UKR0_9ACTN|nr:integral membrane regulator [Streptomyces boluensis]
MRRPPVRRPLVAGACALIALAAATGIVIDLFLGSPLRVLSYFTIQSNVLVAAVLAASAHRAWTGRPALAPWITAGTTLFISITGLVYHLVLANSASDFATTDGPETLTGLHAAANDLLHTVTPIGTALIWLLLTHPGGLRPRHSGLWMLYPLAYLIFALTRGALLPPGSVARYPYPFVDVEQHGYAAILGNSVLFGLVFYALALAIVGLDRIRPTLRPRENRISSTGDGPLK